jgi:hypothetical protein
VAVGSGVALVVIVLVLIAGWLLASGVNAGKHGHSGAATALVAAAVTALLAAYAVLAAG